MRLVSGNIIGFISACLMLWVGVLKNKKKILIVQTIQMALSSLSNFILGGFTGMILNVLGCIRNIVCYKGCLTIIWKVMFIVAAIGLSVSVNNLGFIGLLPVISNVSYICFMNTKDVVKFKLLLVFTTTLWIFYDFYIQSYAYATLDCASVVAHILAIRSLKKNK